MMRMRIKAGLVGLLSGCVLTLALPASAREPVAGGRNLTLTEAVSRALEASEDLKLQDNQVKRKQSEKNEEKARLFPQVHAQLGLTNNFEYPDVAASAATKDYHADIGLTMNQTVFAFGHVAYAISAAQKAFETSRFDRQGTRESVIYETKIAYFQAYLAQRVLTIVQDSYDNALKNKEILEDRAATGRVSKYDNIKIAADIASRKPAVHNARADLASAMETLKVAIGCGSDEAINLKDGFVASYPELKREDLALALKDRQPAIKALASAIEQKQEIIKSQKALLFPQVSAFVTWNHKGDSDDLYIGREQMDDYGVAGLKVNIPVWAAGISRERIHQARIDKQSAQLEYKQGAEQYLLLLDKALSEYREYKGTLQANEEAVRLARESYQYSRELFASGQIAVTDLNDAELQLTNARISKERTLFALNRTVALLERLTLTGIFHEQN